MKIETTASGAEPSTVTFHSHYKGHTWRCIFAAKLLGDGNKGCPHLNSAEVFVHENWYTGTTPSKLLKCWKKAASGLRKLHDHWSLKNITETGRAGRPYLDLTGHVYGLLTVKHRTKNGWWQCRCECGVEKPLRRGALRSGNVRSCGCLKKSGHKKRASLPRGKTESLSPEYGAWRFMIARCDNPRTTGYKNYGARGISVCDRWYAYHDFLADMGRRPSDKHSIDRIDNDGNYELDNCRWATKQEQGLNKRNTIYLTHNEKTLSLIEWAEQTGAVYGTLLDRFNKGYSAKDILGSSPMWDKTRFKKKKPKKRRP